MTWGFVAVAGATVVSGAMSSRSANKATNAASNAEAAQLAFAQEQYDDWKSIYGPIQENLASYYGSLTPEHYESIGLEAIEGEYEVLRGDVDRSLAQRGITDSGVAAAMEKDIGIQEAEAKADVRMNAPAKAAAEQAGFLQIGMGNDPSAGVNRALSDAASGARSRANTAQQSEAAAWGTAAETIGTGLFDYFNKG